MKTLFFLFFSAAFTGVGQIPQVEPRDSTFTKIIDIYIDSLNSYGYAENFVVMVHLTGLLVKDEYLNKQNERFVNVTVPKANLSYEAEVFLTRNSSSFFDVVPSAWFIHRNRRIYISMGGEYLFKLRKNDQEDLLREVKRHLGKTQSGGPIMANMHFRVFGKRIMNSRMLR